MTAIVGARIFDGATLHGGGALVVEAGRIVGPVPAPGVPEGAEVLRLRGGILAPGFVDLQVNGGGGAFVNDAAGPGDLGRIADIHAGLGATTILPTAISDRAEVTRRVLRAAVAAVDAERPGIGGLHLEGPHLAPDRAGAHDPGVLRPMTGADLGLYLEAARRLPCLMITLAPEIVPPAAIARLAGAGVVVALGHTAADAATCRAAIAAGARVATHLHNAMPAMASRAPGPVGAALGAGAVSAGIIADAIHVDPVVLRASLAAKSGPGGAFLVSDAMPSAGTRAAGFPLAGRAVRRAGGRLTLADGTLAGADLDLARALRVATGDIGLPLVRALAMATSIPARVAGLRTDAGHLAPGRSADIVHLSDDLHLRAVWRAGLPVPLSPPCGA